MPSINSSASQALNSYALCLNIHMCSYHGLASQNSEQDHICTISKDIKSFYFYTEIWIGFPLDKRSVLYVTPLCCMTQENWKWLILSGTVYSLVQKGCLSFLYTMFIFILPNISIVCNNRFLVLFVLTVSSSSVSCSFSPFCFGEVIFGSFVFWNKVVTFQARSICYTTVYLLACPIQSAGTPSYTYHVCFIAA
jgi:hypothetical protein